jgi:hypothetical protein
MMSFLYSEIVLGGLKLFWCPILRQVHSVTTPTWEASKAHHKHEAYLAVQTSNKNRNEDTWEEKDLILF